MFINTKITVIFSALLGRGKARWCRIPCPDNSFCAMVVICHLHAIVFGIDRGFLFLICYILRFTYH